MSYGIAFTQAIYVVLFIADKIRQGHFVLVPMSVISETLNIPRPSIVKILQSLSQAGIIETGSGVKGGVKLLKAPQDISLASIFNAIEGNKPLFRLDHTLNVVGAKPEKISSLINGRLNLADQELREGLADTTIQTLMDSL